MTGMRAAIFNGPRSITAGDRPDPAIVESTDAIVRVVFACVCGTDLWFYRGDSPFEPGPIGHEFVGVVEDVGSEVTGIARGDVVIAPYVFVTSRNSNSMPDPEKVRPPPPASDHRRAASA